MSRHIYDLLGPWHKSVTTGKKNNTYKLALALSIIECGRKKLAVGAGAPIEITYQEIIDKWVEYYWDHTSVYKLRQSVNADKAPVILKKLSQFISANTLEGMYWKKLSADQKNKIKERVFRGSSFIDNPISRLPVDHHTEYPTGDPKGKSLFYSWNKDQQVIKLTPAFAELINKEAFILISLVIGEWAVFLERFNAVPSLSTKLQLKEPSRTIPAPIRSLFDRFPDLLGSHECFYCEGPLQDYALDHMVPFSYIFKHDLYNLFPSCQSCNSSKNDKFPKRLFIDKAHERNKSLTVGLTEVPETTWGDADYLRVSLENLVSQCLAGGFREWDGPK